MYTSIYSTELPPVLRKMASVPEMLRLKDVGMHCGCEYTSLPVYSSALEYSRYIHSLGVAGIVWNFTGDIKQAAAGLFHDIATPVFAHTIDFMNDDHMKQESTESRTRAIIENSPEIRKLLQDCGAQVEDVDDYHKYPIADNDTPMLSADRLEYTLGNASLVFRCPLQEIRDIYKDLVVSENEFGTEELCFRTMETAKLFTKISLRNSWWFVSDEERFAMQFLADLMRAAIQKQAVDPEALYLTEKEVIQKMCRDDAVRRLWEEFVHIKGVGISGGKLSDRYCVKVPAKKRYINPLVLTGDTPKRAADADQGIRSEMQAFLEDSYDRWLYCC